MSSKEVLEVEWEVPGLSSSKEMTMVEVQMEEVVVARFNIWVGRPTLCQSSLTRRGLKVCGKARHIKLYYAVSKFGGMGAVWTK